MSAWGANMGFCASFGKTAFAKAGCTEMKIVYGKERNMYFDMNGEEIRDGDFVFMEGKRQKVYLTEDGYLGTDATNPKWIERGWAFECEFGIYPFNEGDAPVLANT